MAGSSSGLPPGFCPSPPDVSLSTSASFSHLPDPSRKFFERLDLSTVHPRCFPGRTVPFQGGSHSPPPEDFVPSSHGNGIFDRIVTGYSQAAPALLAMSELWLRLFAMLIAPLALAYLLRDERRCRILQRLSGDKTGKKGADEPLSTNERRALSVTSVLGLASSAVLLTDSMYVHDMGRLPGAALFVALSVLSTRAYLRRSLSWKTTLIPLFLIKFIVVACLVQSDGHPDAPTVGLGIGGGGGGPSAKGERAGWDAAPHPGIDLPTVPEGLYHSSRNNVMNAIAQSWPIESRTYSVSNGATPWLRTGDSRTGIPFLVNSAPHLPRADMTAATTNAAGAEEQSGSTNPYEGGQTTSMYHRVWVPTPDGEAVALDVAFPPSGVHSPSRPVYLVLHGLNGGSDEEYVREFVSRRTAEDGSTVAVMVARGLMDTPVAGWDVFHGARIDDVHAAAGALRRALGGETKGNNKDGGQILAGVGYSMGAIVLSNYVARSGHNCRLDAAMAVSGGLDMREQLNFYRSMRLWQPMLAKTLRDTFIVGKFESRYRSRLSDEQYLSLMRAAHISSIDEHAVVTYNSFDDLTHYYSEMSAMGDTGAFRSLYSSSSGRTGDNATTCDADGAETEGNANVDLDAPSAMTAEGRIADVSIPFCVLHALDDPLVTWRTMGRDPAKLVESGTGHVMMLLTKSGGHVGWPLGMNPRAEGWRWMNDAVRDFVVAADGALREYGRGRRRRRRS